MTDLARVTGGGAARDTEAFTGHVPLPGYGILTVNAFLIRCAEPVLVDAGTVVAREQYLSAIGNAVDLRDLRWIWLTHTDPDHVGCLYELLAEAPQLKVVTTYLGLGKLGLRRPIEPGRVYLLNPGEALDVGDRRLVAVQPPTFDAPETTGLFDTRTRTLFSADTFGALLSEPAGSAADIPPSALREGMAIWTTVDAPWVGAVAEAAFTSALDSVRQLEPEVVLSSHLPPAPGMLDALLSHLARARTAEPFVGPDQASFMQSIGPG